MYRITYAINVGGNQIPLISSVAVKTSVESISNTATIEIPATAFKKRLLTPSLLRKGQSVSIALGYDDNNNTEFEGYVTKLTDLDGGMLIECEDATYLFRSAQMENKEYKNVSVDTLINACVNAVNEQNDTWDTISYENDLKFDYGKFTIQNASAFDVMKKIQEETHADFWWDGLTLKIQARYMNTGDANVRYSFQRNIDKNGLDLTWRSAEQSKLYVEVIGRGKEETTGKNGKTVTKVTENRATAGEMGGDKITEKISGVTDKNALQSIANDIYAHRHYTGFEGSFQGWLTPYCKGGDSVSLADEDDETRNGKYYVLATEVSVSSSGGIRKIKLGHKL